MFVTFRGFKRFVLMRKSQRRDGNLGKQNLARLQKIGAVWLRAFSFERCGCALARAKPVAGGQEDAGAARGAKSTRTHAAASCQWCSESCGNCKRRHPSNNTPRPSRRNGRQPPGKTANGAPLKAPQTCTCARALTAVAAAGLVAAGAQAGVSRYDCGRGLGVWLRAFSFERCGCALARAKPVAGGQEDAGAARGARSTHTHAAASCQWRSESCGNCKRRHPSNNTPLEAQRQAAPWKYRNRCIPRRMRAHTHRRRSRRARSGQRAGWSEQVRLRAGCGRLGGARSVLVGGRAGCPSAQSACSQRGCGREGDARCAPAVPYARQPARGSEPARVSRPWEKGRAPSAHLHPPELQLVPFGTSTQSPALRPAISANAVGCLGCGGGVVARGAGGPRFGP
jgi:hypothetical protein